MANRKIATSTRWSSRCSPSFWTLPFLDQFFVKQKKTRCCEQMQDMNMHVCMYLHMYNVYIYIYLYIYNYVYIYMNNYIYIIPFGCSNLSPFLPLVIRIIGATTNPKFISLVEAAEALASLKLLAVPMSSERRSTITSNMVTLVWVTVGLNEAKVC